MRCRPCRTAVVAWVILFVQGARLSSAAGDATDPVETARRLLDAGKPRLAVAILEENIVETPSDDPQKRSQRLDILKRAYKAAATQAEAAGDHPSAKQYLENLAILDHRKQPETFDPQDAKTPNKAALDRAINSEPKTPAVVDASSRPGGLKFNDMLKQVLQKAAPPSRAKPEPRFGLPPLPGAPQPHSPQPQPEATDREPAVAPVEPAAMPPLPVNPRSSSGEQSELDAADVAFAARDYARAGKLYSNLHYQGRLPDDRRGPCAYCRWHELVGAINAHPTSEREWMKIAAEIDEVERIAPRHWFSEYLRGLASEKAPRRVKKQLASQPKKPSDRASARITPRNARAGAPAPLIRGASPEDAESPASPPAHEPATKAEPRAWSTLESKNFRIHYQNAALAERVARAAELARGEQGRRWRGANRPDLTWESRCDLYLYPDAASYAEATGQSAETAGFSTTGTSAGRIVMRRISLRADHPRLLTAVLPHEVTHLVLADLFNEVAIPQWADEGMAALAEPADIQRERGDELLKLVGTDRLPTLAAVLGTRATQTGDRPALHLMGLSITKFLVDLSTPEQFVDFLQASERNGYDSELQRVYGLNGVEDLERSWLANISKNRDTHVAPAAAAQQ